MINLNPVIALLLMCSVLFSCSDSGGNGNQSRTATEHLEMEMTGTYLAVLSPVNKKVSGHLNGSLTLVRERDEFIADVRLSGGPKAVLHTQSIHVGERCPDENDDLNRDGFIDGEEGAQVYKEALIPLDDDLSSQRMGLGIYPVTDDFGYYFWSRTVSFEKMLQDLRDEDINLDDDYVKLTNEKTFRPFSKVVVIKGIPTQEKLPSTVSGRGRQSPHEALPIACGVIRKLTSIPGVIDNDMTGIPVPEGDTVGGSSGVDDGAVFTSTGTTGETGNYGEEDEPETTTNSTEFGTTGGIPL